MSRLGSFAIFFTIMLVIVGGIHYYLWARLVRDTAWAPPFSRIATVALIVLASSLPLSFILLRALPRSIAEVVLFPVFTWMGIMFLLFVLVSVTDLASFLGGVIFRLSGGPWPLDPERRTFLARVIAGGVLAVAGGSAAVGMTAALGRAVVRDVRITLAKLPRSFSGFTIVQLSDLHVGPTLGRSFIEDIVARTNALKPDLIAVTGDLVDGSVHQLRNAVEPLADLRSTHGTYFVTGNHEYYSGVNEWLPELRRLGIRVLRNERVQVNREQDAIDVAGVDDWSSGGLADGHAPSLTQALAGRDSSRSVVLLAHQPRAVHEAAKMGVDLQLSGHTHGGQIWPFRFFVRLVQPLVAGLGRFGNTQIYVSRGTGFWGPPMRLGEPAEITRIVLQSGQVAAS